MRQRILIVGASGTLGKAVVAELSPHHDILTAGRNSGDIRMDITDADSILRGFEQAGRLDAVISTAGHVKFAPFSDFKTAAFGVSLHTLGISDKMLGQINLALAARDVLNRGGSITLTTGILSERFIKQASSATMVNRAVEGFVQAAAFEMQDSLRINVVSPNVFEESMHKYADFFPGFTPVPVSRAAKAFRCSIEGSETGQIYKVF